MRVRLPPYLSVVVNHVHVLEHENVRSGRTLALGANLQGRVGIQVRSQFQSQGSVCYLFSFGCSGEE